MESGGEMEQHSQYHPDLPRRSIPANFFSMKYRRRSGATETFSVSIDKETKTVLKERAARLYGGNMSALISDLGRHAERAEAVGRLLGRAGGSTLTDAIRRQIDAELELGWRHVRGRTKKTKRVKKNRAA